MPKFAENWIAPPASSIHVCASPGESHNARSLKSVEPTWAPCRLSAPKRARQTRHTHQTQPVCRRPRMTCFPTTTTIRVALRHIQTRLSAIAIAGIETLEVPHRRPVHRTLQISQTVAIVRLEHRPTPIVFVEQHRRQALGICSTVLV